MRIPFWQRAEAHPTRVIDRASANRSRRHLVGVEVSRDLSAVLSSHVMVRGSGRHTHASVLSVLEHPIDRSTRNSFRAILEADSVNAASLGFVAAELAGFQATCIEKLIAQSGRQKNDFVAAAIFDHGIGLQDVDGKEYFPSLTDAPIVASQVGLNIIDRFQERDRIEGGSGTPLFPLCFWFMFADRNEKIATENRLLIHDSPDAVELYWLPASDGLDSLLPDLRYHSVQKDEWKSQAPGMIDLLEQQFGQLNGVILDDSLDGSSLRQQFESKKIRVEWLSEKACQGKFLNSSATALLGTAFIDQFPMTIPELTGNTRPQVLGMLTPGSVASFRNYVLEASRVSPSIMKLRDAV